MTGGRLYIRWRRRTAGIDDVLNSAALATLIALTATLQLNMDLSNQSVLGWTSEDVDNLDSLLVRYAFASSILGWATLYLVKASFLALYWTLFKISQRFRIAWWTTTIYTFVTFSAILVFQLWQCGSPSNAFDPAACQFQVGSDLANTLSRMAKIAVVLHTTSTGLILVLPIVMIWKLQLSRAQKFSLAAVFALVLIDIAMGIVRNTAYICTMDSQAPAEFAVAYKCFDIFGFMSRCEPSVAVIICALPAYRVLLHPSRRTLKQRQSPMVERGALPQWSPALQRPSAAALRTRTLLGPGYFSASETERKRLVEESHEMHSLSGLRRINALDTLLSMHRDTRPRMSHRT